VKPEDRLVEKLAALALPGGPVEIGPGDDAAVVAREAGLLAATTDMLVEGVDFLPDEDPERLGRRAAAVNLSDLAAMGAEPEFFLLAVGFPPERGEDVPLAIARGAAARAAEFGARLIGGDLSSAPQIVITAAFWGRPIARPLTRAGARPGDVVYVSGHPGEAAAGLHLARKIAAFHSPAARFAELSANHQQRLLAAFHDPNPRVALGLLLANEGLATAAIDVSDGLGVDAGRLARASGVRLVLERERLPVSSALLAFAAAEELDPVDFAVAGGDDYELLFTVRAADVDRFDERTSALKMTVREIGRVAEGAGAALSGPRGEREIDELGHDHFEAVR
jgi:thiamine-monophosphate kinase